MNTLYFICDESGAKGYADKSESYFGEVGIVAGYFIPDEHVDLLRRELLAITSQFATDGKLHITDLPNKDKETLREYVFQYFITRNIVCTYEAVFSEGFHKAHVDDIRRREEARKSRPSTIQLSNHEKVEMLHAKLLLGAFVKAVSFCIDHVGNEANIKIITDQIDKPIINMFTKMADRFLNIGEKSTKIIAGWDKQKGAKIQKTITTKTSDPSGYLLDLSKIKYEISCETSPLTVAADVIANSINYHFRSKPDSADALPNTPDAIPNHPLHPLFYGMWEDVNINWFADAIYMHPEYNDCPD